MARGAERGRLGFIIHLLAHARMETHLTRNATIIGWLAGIGIPLAIVFAGWLITTSIETSKLDSEYVKIALGVLAAKEKSADGKLVESTADEKVLKQWAVRLLNKKSPEKFTKEEQDALLQSPGIMRAEWISPFGPIQMRMDQRLKEESTDLPRKQLEFSPGTRY